MLVPLAASLTWGRPSGTEAECRALLAAAPHRFAGREHLTRCPNGVIGFRTIRGHSDKNTLWCDNSSQVAVVIDARIHNRLTLAERLELDPETATNAEIVGRAYLEWRSEFVTKLVGDFALILCDWGRREVCLATGPSAVRMLFFISHENGVFVGSDPQQFHTVRPFSLSDVDPETVSEYLLLRHGRPSRTFYRPLERVAPGWRVVLGRGRMEATRFFLPPRAQTILGTSEEYEREFARSFRQCVEDSVDSGSRHFVHLSGGLDSASIVAALAEMHGSDSATSFDVITGLFPTVPSCNETAAVIAVQSRVPFRKRYWDAEALPDLSSEVNLSVWPLGLVPTAIANYDELHLAGEEGAVAVLSGDSGDSLVMELGVFRDMVAGRRWRDLWNQLGAEGLNPLVRRNIIRAVILNICGQVLGPLARFSHRRIVPTWAGPTLAQVFRNLPDATGSNDESETHLFSHVQKRMWVTLTSPNDHWFFEAMQMRAVRAGTELRCPYRDQRLIAFVASIPFTFRFPDGTLRRLQRRGLADLIPSLVRNRRKTTFEPAVRALFLRRKEKMDETFHDGTWLSAPYVKLTAVRGIMKDAEHSSDFKTWHFLRAVWTLELWLRRHVV